ncbi:MAG: hypothetical protein VKO39_03710 [Cyanobacteriota bacterium]|nr:hypothetical protein [Cyanobacteriota bacterium]
MRFYVPMVLTSVLACIYAYFKPGITSPRYPQAEMKKALAKINSASLISDTSKILNYDTSDRKISPLFSYNYSDGSKILALVARVKKRDDFKIETYGLLTKNIDPIYLKNASFVNTAPHSLVGMIDKKKSLQTCIIPKTTRLEDSDIRLSELTSTLEELTPHASSWLDKIMGTKKHIDYSCLVMTYMPPNNTQSLPNEDWTVIIKNTQKALLNQSNSSSPTK